MPCLVADSTMPIPCPHHPWAMHRSIIAPMTGQGSVATKAYRQPGCSARYASRIEDDTPLGPRPRTAIWSREQLVDYALFVISSPSSLFFSFPALEFSYIAIIN
jgi:hypothetical protein